MVCSLRVAKMLWLGGISSILVCNVCNVCFYFCYQFCITVYCFYYY